MRVERLMAKMTARGLVISGGGFGGAVELSWTDVAAGLGGLNRVTTELMRTMYLGDHRGDALVLAELRKFICEVAALNQVKVTPAVVEGLAVLALFEVVNPPQCVPCSASGLVRLRGGGGQACQKCAGTGIGHRGAREQAAIAGIPRTTYDRHYARLAGQAYQECARWLDVGVRHLSRRLADVA